MSGWWTSGLLVVILSVTLVNSKVDLDSPLRLAQCRATCLYKIHMAQLSDERCDTSTDCKQCWEACQLIQGSEDIPSFCDQPGCGQGCLEACRFHSLPPSRKPPVLLTQHEEALSFSDAGATWPSSESDAVPVYVVMGQEATKPWSQVCQTLNNGAKIPLEVNLESVRVLVVEWRGLAKVYSARTESSLAEVQTIIRSLGMENRLGLSKLLRARNSTQHLPLRIQKAKPTMPWELKEVSMIHQSALVLAQISWNPQHLDSDSQPIYLVTWEVDGGVLRGNLLTNSTCVTLSLWAETVYRIQVSVLNPELRAHSEPLVIDTRYAHTVLPGAVHRPSDTPLEVVAGLTAAVLMFLVVTLTVTWRWHRCLPLPHSKLIDASSETSNLYRVFPPVVRLMGTSHDVPELFCSTDKLIQNN